MSCPHPLMFWTNASGSSYLLVDGHSDTSRLSNKNHPNLTTKKAILCRRHVREELLDDLLNGGKCRELIRISEQDFKKLCTILQRDGGLRPTQRMFVEEPVARFLHIVGRYCLVDAGLPQTSTLMTPYRGVRYHLKEYSARAPENTRYFFNIRHASLHNDIQRAFGVLKKGFLSLEVHKNLFILVKHN